MTRCARLSYGGAELNATCTASGMINAPLAATLANQSILRNAFRRSSKSILRLSSDPACRPRVEEWIIEASDRC